MILYLIYGVLGLFLVPICVGICIFLAFMLLIVIVRMLHWLGCHKLCFCFMWLTEKLFDSLGYNDGVRFNKIDFKEAAEDTNSPAETK